MIYSGLVEERTGIVVLRFYFILFFYFCLVGV